MEELFKILIDSDHLLFAKINQGWTNPLFDQFFPFITNFQNTQWLILAALIIWIISQKKRAVKIIFGCILSVGLADLAADRIVKPFFHRDRPQFALTHVRLLVPEQGSPSFPSNHATNVYAAAVFIGTMVPQARTFLWIIAFLVAYSRVYVGVHFPSDVFGGAVLGIFCAVTIYRLWGHRIHSQGTVWIEEKPRIPRYRRKRQGQVNPPP